MVEVEQAQTEMVEMPVPARRDRRPRCLVLRPPLERAWGRKRPHKACRIEGGQVGHVRLQKLRRCMASRIEMVALNGWTVGQARRRCRG